MNPSTVPKCIDHGGIHDICCCLWRDTTYSKTVTVTVTRILPGTRIVTIAVPLTLLHLQEYNICERCFGRAAHKHHPFVKRERKAT